jgi:hypothetical protein
MQVQFGYQAASFRNEFNVVDQSGATKEDRDRDEMMLI